VGGDELAIEQRVSAAPQARDKMRERDLAGVGSAAEHALAEERAAEGDAIKATDQRFVGPHFNRMRMADAVQRDDRIADDRVDPCLFPIRASVEHIIKRTIDTRAEAARLERFGQRMREMKLVKRKNAALFGFDPIDLVGIRAIRHRENTAGISAQEDLGGEGHCSCPVAQDAQSVNRHPKLDLGSSPIQTR